MTLKENWAVPLDTAEKFFRAQADILHTGDGFMFEDCHISLSALSPNKLGSLSFPRTRLCLDGSEESVKTVRRRFMLQFLSAGG